MTCLNTFLRSLHCWWAFGWLILCRETRHMQQMAQTDRNWTRNSLLRCVCICSYVLFGFFFCPKNSWNPKDSIQLQKKMNYHCLSQSSNRLIYQLSDLKYLKRWGNLNFLRFICRLFFYDKCNLTSENKYISKTARRRESKAEKGKALEERSCPPPLCN